MNAKIVVLVICVEAIIYLLLYNLHDCTFNFEQVNMPTRLEKNPFKFLLIIPHF